MNLHAIKAIYIFELARTWRTLMQSIASPVISTSLYFIVFGSAIGSRMQEIDGISYGAFIVPGLLMLSMVTESVSNASFGIYFPKYSGTIYEILSAPISPFLNWAVAPPRSDVVMFGAGRMEPPGTWTSGMSRRAAAIRWAGIDLSQLDSSTPAS